jgi:hypothetical protein
MIVAAPLVSRQAAVSARRIRFVSAVAPDDDVLAEFTAPEHRYAVSEPLDPEMLCRPQGAEPEDAFLFLFLPGGNTSSPHWQERAERWVARPTTSAVPTVELVLRSDRILWRPGRAVLVGSAERLEETLAGLIEFAFYEGQLRRLEREGQADWATAEADVALTHRVSSRARRCWPHVAAMTERVARRRIHFARLEPHLEKAAMHLAGPARRLVSELLLQAETQNRIRAVDDGLEVLEDLYELANDRLSEFTYYWKEHRLEIWIVVLLVAEVVLLLLEIGLHWVGD